MSDGRYMPIWYGRRRQQVTCEKRVVTSRFAVTDIPTSSEHARILNVVLAFTSINTSDRCPHDSAGTMTAAANNTEFLPALH